MSETSMAHQLDHLVIAARSLDEGVAWCEATLGVVPGPGGEHALFGTHNRLLQLACEGAPNAYLEIIAINPDATPTLAAPAKRWFDLDDLAMHEALAGQGPQLIHWVARVPDLNQALATCLAQGIDRGAAIMASRPTPQGLLEWQIGMREDGQRLFGGCLPTLIQWGDTHPAAYMPRSGLRLQSLSATHPQAAALTSVLDALGLQRVNVSQGAAQLQSVLETPKGLVTLGSSIPSNSTPT
jgi:hypothetical protein